MKLKPYFFWLGIPFILIHLAQASSFFQETSSNQVRSPLSIVLSTPSDQFKIGSPIVATITLTNTSAAKFTYEWESPEPAYRNFHFALTLDGGQVPKTVFHRKMRGEQLPGDPVEVFSGKSIFVTLSPGQSVQFTINVETLYTITQPGSYVLVVDRNDDLNKIKLQSQPLRLIVTH